MEPHDLVPGWYLDVRRRLDLTVAMVELLAGDIALELWGDLTRVAEDIGALPGASIVRGKAEIPLDRLQAKRLLRRVTTRVGIHRNLWCIVIHRDRRPLFVAVDGFSEGQVWCDASIGEDVLRRLLERRVIHSYSPGTCWATLPDDDL